MADYSDVDRYLHAHLDQSIAELSRLCAQPSVSALNLGLDECADLVGTMLQARGFQVDVLRSEGPPVVFAERKGRSEKTLLFYNHYDVQPAEPLDLWETPAFCPTLRDGKLFARGVNDDKGPLVSRLFAIDALLDAYGELPCHVKFVIEGEEETSSAHLKDFVVKNTQRLAADACIWEAGGVDEFDQPYQSLGMRGICYVELSVETASQDVHSGVGGSIFPNAAWRLIWALNTLKGSDETILIPGFYDKIRPISPRDRELVALLPDDSEEYRRRYGIRGFLNNMQGGVGLRLAETHQPTCTICGLTAGYQGPGSKTVLPARATAKIDFRLVPDQNPEEILVLLRQHLDRQDFNDIQITSLGGESPAKTDPNDPFVHLVVAQAQEVYQKPVHIVPMIGGSGPNYVFKEYLHVPIATAGVGHPGSQIHAPNENIRLDLYLRGAQFITRILTAFGQESA